MTHSQDTAEAVDVPVTDIDSAAAAIGQLWGDEGPAAEPDEDQDEQDQSEDQAEELDLSDDEDGEDDEPAAPAIDAPASLTAEEKAKFAQLTEEAQRYVADLESRRAEQVQKATTKASEAQREAEVRAAQADAMAKDKYAQQLKALGDRLSPQAPDPAMASYDPAAYIAQKAQYDAAKAQHDDFMQQVQALGQEAESEFTQAEIAERDRFLMTIPEVQNEETRTAFFDKAIGAAKTLGLDLNGLGRASGAEWKALRQVSDWQDKAAKYDAAMARQMQRVREGKKGKAAKPNAAQTAGKQRAFTEATGRLRQSGSLDDAAAAIARLG